MTELFNNSSCCGGSYLLASKLASVAMWLKGISNSTVSQYNLPPGLRSNLVVMSDHNNSASLAIYLVE